MIGVDSNILLRHILADDPKWTDAAISFFDETCTTENPAYINSIVLAETIWVLRRLPSFGKEKVISFVRGLLDSSSVVLGDKGAVEMALKNYNKHSTEFTDCLIAALNMQAAAVPTYTIDQKATKAAGFSALKKR
jgi:predicted nucleic-acid-binding protein